MPIFRFLGKNSRFWESLTKKKIKGHFQGKTWIFQEFFVRFGNVDENPRFGPKNVDGLFFLVATLAKTIMKSAMEQESYCYVGSFDENVGMRQ